MDEVPLSITLQENFYRPMADQKPSSKETIGSAMTTKSGLFKEHKERDSRWERGDPCLVDSKIKDSLRNRLSFDIEWGGAPLIETFTNLFLGFSDSMILKRLTDPCNK